MEEKSADKKTQGLPTETSPYTQYKDLEDYKEKGYGTKGHVDPDPNVGPPPAGSTDAPTVAGGATGDRKSELSTQTPAGNRR